MRKSVRFFLDRKTADRPVPLFMYFSFGYKEIQAGKTKYLPLKYSTGHVVHPGQWDADNQRIRDSHPDAEDINNTLEEMKVEAIRSHNSLRDRKRTNQDVLITPQKIKHELDIYFKGKQSDKTERITEYIPALIIRQRAKREITSRTLDHWNSFNNILMEYEKKYRTNLYFDSIGHEFYDKYIILLRDRGQADSTIGKNIKMLKTILGHATREGYNTNMVYQQFKGMAPEADTVYLTTQQIMTLYHSDLKDSPYLERVRDQFVLGCFTGMRYSDQVNLTRENIQTDKNARKYIDYISEKTDRKTTVYLNEVVLTILEKYEYQIPSISNQKSNKYLKEVCKKAGFRSDFKKSRVVAGKREYENVPLHDEIKTHTGRRSFCTNLYLEGIPVEDIMGQSGHASPRELMKYIKADSLQKAQRSNDTPYLNVTPNDFKDETVKLKVV